MGFHLGRSALLTRPTPMMNVISGENKSVFDFQFVYIVFGSDYRLVHFRLNGARNVTVTAVLSIRRKNSTLFFYRKYYLHNYIILQQFLGCRRRIWTHLQQEIFQNICDQNGQCFFTLIRKCMAKFVCCRLFSAIAV